MNSSGCGVYNRSAKNAYALQNTDHLTADSILFVFVILPFALRFLVASYLSHGFDNLIILLILFFVPVNIILTGDLLDLFSVSIRFLYKRVPFLYFKASLLIQLCLFTTDRQIKCRTVGDFPVMVEKPKIATNQCGETNKVLKTYQ